MCREMVQADLALFERDAYLQAGGHGAGWHPAAKLVTDIKKAWFMLGTEVKKTPSRSRRPSPTGKSENEAIFSPCRTRKRRKR